MSISFTFKAENQQIPHVHWFEMKRSGRGWKTVECSADFFHLKCPLECEELTTMPLRGYETLRKIKNSFDENVFAFVVDGHLTAPSTLYQVVIEGVTEKQKEACLAHFRRRENLYCDYLFDIRWLDQLPKDRIHELTSY